MKALVSSGQHFVLTEDGTLWAPIAAESYHFWARYLEVYDEIYLCARAAFASTPPVGWIVSSGPGVKPAPVPDFYGLLGLIRTYRSVRQKVSQFLEQVQAIQLRISCPLGNEIWRLLSPQRPYGVEVISDPYDVFAAGAINHPLRPFFRWYLPRILRQQCWRACAAAYVTEKALQRRYPPGPTTLATGYSDVELTDSSFVRAPRLAPLKNDLIRLILVGNLRQLYKAPHILLESLRVCVQEIGLNLELVIAGDGQYRAQLEQQALLSGLGSRVRFTGQLATREEIVAELDQAALFVMPSFQEGLPRAMVEAMARALPCIGSTAGGIPELLATEDLVPPGDVVALADKIREVVTNPRRMTSMSVRNLERARAFHEDRLRKRRIAFYQQVRKQTEQWECSHN